MKPLYAIDNELLCLLDMLDDDGEIPADLESAIDALAMDRTTKIENICKAITNDEAFDAMVQAEIDQVEAEVRRLKAAQSARVSHADWLKGYLKRSLIAHGQKKLEAGTFRLSVVKNSQPAVTVEIDPEKLPEWARRIKVEPDKVAIGAKWKEDGTIPAGCSVDQGTHLRIS